MHLAEDQIIGVVCGGASDAELQHARHCAECGRAVEYLKQRFEQAQTEYFRAAERDDNFWLRQQAAIRNRRRPAQGTVPVPRWAMAVAALVVLAAGLILSGPPAPTVAHTAQSSDPDYQLLVAVEQNLARPVPVAIEPARVLSADLNAAWQNTFGEDARQQKTAQR